MAQGHGHSAPGWISWLGNRFGKHAGSDAGGFSQAAWVLVFTLILFGLGAMLHGDLRFGFMVATGLAIAKFCWVNIPASGEDGPSVALLTIWGRRLPIIVHEGDVLLLNFFPFLINVIIIRAKKVEIECSTTVICELNPKNKVDEMDAQVEVKFEITFVPNFEGHHGGQMLINYENIGGELGARKNLIGTMLSAIRIVATRYQWETFAKLQSALNAHLMMLISDKKLKVLKRVGGKIPARTIKHYEDDTDDYERIPNEVEDALEYAEDKTVSREEHLNRLHEIEVFLHNALNNGGGEMDDTGIRITRLNVTDISPTGGLKKVVDLAAQQNVRNRAQELRRKELIKSAKKYASSSGGSMTFAEGLIAARIDLNESSEVNIRTSGRGGTLAVIGNQKGSSS